MCKKCKRAFRKDVTEFEERSKKLTHTILYFGVDIHSDEYCPHCDNHFILDAVTPKAALKVESEDTRVDARLVLHKAISIYTDIFP